MKVRLNVILNAPDDYTCGDCKKCPIHQEAHFSTHQYKETKIGCPLGYNSVSCPIEVKNEVQEEQDEEQEKWLISAFCERNGENTKCVNCVNHNYCDYEP